jgi:hypothetical protein
MTTHLTRRTFIASSAALALPAYAQSVARVVVIGGGFGGATAARWLNPTASSPPARSAMK